MNDNITALAADVPHVARSGEDGLASASYSAGEDSHRNTDCLPTQSLAGPRHVARAIFLSNYVNYLLIIVPLGIANGALGRDPTTIFTFNIVAIIPLSAVLLSLTDTISTNLGKGLGELATSVLGNATELIVSFAVLRNGQIEVLKSSMLGSILFCLLLVMGFCFLLSGIIQRDAPGKGREQLFPAAIAQTTCPLMVVSLAALVVPATLYDVLERNGTDNIDQRIILLSRATAATLLLVYAFYLLFRFRTHANFFDAESPAIGSRGESHELDRPMIGARSAIIAFMIGSMLVVICAEYLARSTDAVVSHTRFSKSFIGMFVVPVVGNLPKHVRAIRFAVRNQMSMAVDIAIGSSIQTALGVTPSLIIVGWIIGKLMSLRFEKFESALFAVSVLVAAYTIQDGRSNYLEGVMLLCLYVIIAVGFLASSGGLGIPPA